MLLPFGNALCLSVPIARRSGSIAGNTAAILYWPSASSAFGFTFGALPRCLSAYDKSDQPRGAGGKPITRAIEIKRILLVFLDFDNGRLSNIRA